MKLYTIALGVFFLGYCAQTASSAELTSTPRRGAYGTDVTLSLLLTEGTSTDATVHLMVGDNVGPTRTGSGFLPLGGNIRSVLDIEARTNRLDRIFELQRANGRLLGKRFVLAFVTIENNEITSTSNALVATFGADEVIFETPPFPSSFGFSPRTVDSSQTLHAVDMINNEGWAVGLPPLGSQSGNKNTVLWTGDRGDSWQPVEIDRFRSVQLEAVDFVTPSIGYIGGNYLGRGNVYATTDGGISFQSTSFGHPVRDLSFFNASNGYAVGNNGTFDDVMPISRTRDGGATWEPQLPDAAVDLYAIDALDENIAFAAGRTLADRASLHQTSDGGENWNPVDLPVPERRWLLGLGHTQGQNPQIFAVGARGTIYRSEDQGATFDLIPSGTLRDLRSVRFLTEQLGWIAGDHGTLLATTNGGETWIPFATGIEGGNNEQIVLDFFPKSANRCFAVGYEGLFLEFGRLEE